MTRRYSAWEEVESHEEILPRLGEYRFYRDPEKGDTLVIIGDDADRIYLVNPLEVPTGRFDKKTLFALQFGAVGTIFLLVWERHLENALEEAAGWLKEHAPGYIVSDETMKEYYDEARAELGEEAEEHEVSERAEADLTYTESGYIPSYEWWGGDASDKLAEAGSYVSRAVYAAEYRSYDLVKPGEEVGTELTQEELERLFSDEELGLTAEEVMKIAELDRGQRADLPQLSIERYD